MENIGKLFVYGSLRSGFHHPACDYISKYFTLLSEAKVKGLLFDLGDYPGAIPTAEGSFIKGELYELKKPGEFECAIHQLDDYEGVNPEKGEKQLFIREVTDVFCNNKSTKAWIYWYNMELSTQPIMPSGDTVDYLTYKIKQ
jgi:gamma-glutamylcyclotransferase (GGCT)/AIG2-like uncharacterized protein YtfP